MPLFSVLDLTPIKQGGSAAATFRETLELARHAERLGYHRYWLVEHHNTTGVAGSATAVVMGHVAENTSTIRVGAGGIMLPNHAPLIVAEQFGTLAALYPGRIDLGLGRGINSDPATMQALRRIPGDMEEFPRDVQELLSYLRAAAPGQAVRAIFGGVVESVMTIPGQGKMVIISHGTYYTVFANLATVSVKAKDKVNVLGNIGTARTDPGSGETKVYFQLNQDKTAMDPEVWLGKKS